MSRAWRTAVLKAHGHTPVYTTTANLTAESRAALKAINLHFHDLRREAGSRWMDGGVPIATIQRWLGHSNVSQTSTYLAGTQTSEHDAMARFEAQQAALQRIATEGQKRGQKATRSTAKRHRTPNKSAVDSNPTLM
jgi:integrase